MKIYITDYVPKNSINIETKLNGLNKTITNYKDIYSSEGLFRIKNNIIYQLIPKDNTVEKFKYNNI